MFRGMGKGLIWDTGEEMLGEMEEGMLGGLGEGLLWGLGVGLIKEVASVANAVDCSLDSDNETVPAAPEGWDVSLRSFCCCSWRILASMFSCCT